MKVRMLFVPFKHLIRFSANYTELTIFYNRKAFKLSLAVFRGQLKFFSVSSHGHSIGEVELYCSNSRRHFKRFLSKSGMGDKDETYWRILNAALRLDFKRGHLRWTITELSRTTKVARSLIYYYFGKSKNAILVAALQLIGEDLFGLNQERIGLWNEGKIEESILRSRSAVRANPHIVAFYFAHRADESPIGEKLRELEVSYRKKLEKMLPEKSEEEIKSITALNLGRVICPF